VTGAALIVIDVQKGLLSDSGKVYDAEGVLTRINQLVSRARTHGVPVIFVQHQGEAGHPLEKPSEGWQIHPATGYRPDDVVIEKRNCDAFQDTELQSQLEASSISNIVLAGMCSDYCVDTTCRRAFSLGYDVVLASDAHTTLSKDHMSAEMIVQHHNVILGSDFAKGLPSEQIEFRD
jgi:nicotinamidase-related amidase